MNPDMKLLYSTTVPNNSYELELVRRQSFKECIDLVDFPINDAAKMGLYYKLDDTLQDFVFCIHCGISIPNWMCNDVKIKHDEISPYCTEGMNIPIEYDYLTQYILNAKFILYMRDTNNMADIVVDENNSIEDWIEGYRICVNSMIDYEFVLESIHDIVGFYSEDTLDLCDLDFQDYDNVLDQLENIKKYGKLSPKTEENQI